MYNIWNDPLSKNIEDKIKEINKRTGIDMDTIKLVEKASYQILIDSIEGNFMKEK